MKLLFRSLFPILALAFMSSGCEKAVSSPKNEVLFQTIEDNASAFNKKDVDGVMATIHSKMPGFAQLREFISQTFGQYELKVSVSDLKVVTSSPEEARVSFTQKTQQITDGHLVPLNIIEGVDILRPENGTWKIISTVQTKLTRLNETAPEAAESKPAGTEPTPATATPHPESTPPPPVPAEKPPQ